MAPKAKSKTRSTSSGAAKPKARSNSAKPKAKAKAESAPAGGSASSSAEAVAPEPEPVHVPVEGTTKVRYNHYNKDFNVSDGRLKWEDIDKEYCISFAFDGNFTTKLKGPDGVEFQNEKGIFSGLTLDVQYVLEVDEDPEIENEPRTVYVAPSGGNNFIRTGGEGGGLGEDSASCSCLFGNPCAQAYSCKDWNNRFEVAKKNGWKGFS